MEKDNMDEFSLSVIIPNFNNSQYLECCVNSMMRQTLKPDEIIIVDDCSTDCSKKVIEALEERYLIVKGIFLPQNKGVSNARNIGLASAVSNYVTFTDADDFYYAENKLKNEMDLIKSHAQVGEDIVAYSAFVRTDKEGKVVNFPNLLPSKFMEGNVHLDLISRMKRGNIPRDYCVKKGLILKAGAYSYHKNFYEDLDLLLRLSRIACFYSTHQHGIAYRMTDHGLSRKSKKEHTLAVKTIIGTYYSQLTIKEKWIVFYKHYFGRLVNKMNLGQI